MGLFRIDCCIAGLRAATADEVVEALAARLLAAGLVHPTYAAATLARERVSPTGIPFAGRKAAIPHCDPEHVIAAGAAVCTLREPVGFRAMGDPDTILPVDVVVALALPDAAAAQGALVDLVERFQKAEYLEALCAATGAAELHSLITGG